MTDFIRIIETICSTVTYNAHRFIAIDSRTDSVPSQAKTWSTKPPVRLIKQFRLDCNQSSTYIRLPRDMAQNPNRLTVKWPLPIDFMADYGRRSRSTD